MMTVNYCGFIFIFLFLCFWNAPAFGQTASPTTSSRPTPSPTPNGWLVLRAHPNTTFEDKSSIIAISGTATNKCIRVYLPDSRKNTAFASNFKIRCQGNRELSLDLYFDEDCQTSVPLNSQPLPIDDTMIKFFLANVNDQMQQASYSMECLSYDALPIPLKESFAFNYSYNALNFCRDNKVASFTAYREQYCFSMFDRSTQSPYRVEYSLPYITRFSDVSCNVKTKTDKIFVNSCRVPIAKNYYDYEYARTTAAAFEEQEEGLYPPFSPGAFVNMNAALVRFAQERLLARRTSEEETATTTTTNLRGDGVNSGGIAAEEQNTNHKDRTQQEGQEQKELLSSEYFIPQDSGDTPNSYGSTSEQDPPEWDDEFDDYWSGGGDNSPSMSPAPSKAPVVGGTPTPTYQAQPDSHQLYVKWRTELVNSPTAKPSLLPGHTARPSRKPTIEVTPPPSRGQGFKFTTQMGLKGQWPAGYLAEEVENNLIFCKTISYIVGGGVRPGDVVITSLTDATVPYRIPGTNFIDGGPKCEINYEIHYDAIELGFPGDPQGAYGSVKATLEDGLASKAFDDALHHYAGQRGNTAMLVITAPYTPRIATYVSTEEPEPTNNSGGSGGSPTLSDESLIMILAGGGGALIVVLSIMCCCFWSYRKSAPVIEGSSGRGSARGSSGRGSVATAFSASVSDKVGRSGSNETSTAEFNTVKVQRGTNVTLTPTAVAVVIHDDAPQGRASTYAV